MELRQLEYFQMVSQLSSISKAAEQAHVSQPSVSIAIQKLEDELGVKLLDRSQRQLALTPEGRTFAERVGEILTRIGDSVAEMKDLKLLQKGSIRIGIPPMTGVFLFPHIFAQFRQSHPHLEFTAVEGGSLSIQSLLEQGRLDIGIITKTNRSTNLKTLPMTQGEIYVCLHPNHPMSSLSAIDFSKLKKDPFILLKEDTYNRQIIMRECQKHKFTPRIIFSSSQIETIIGLVEQGIGISFLVDAITRKHNTICSLPLADPIYYEIVLAWNRHRYLSSAARAFIEFITSSYPKP